MAWIGKILSVENRFDSVNVTVEMVEDKTGTLFSKVYTFINAGDVNKDMITKLVQTELSKVGDLFVNAAALKLEIGKPISVAIKG